MSLNAYYVCAGILAGQPKARKALVLVFFFSCLLSPFFFRYILEKREINWVKGGYWWKHVTGANRGRQIGTERGRSTQDSNTDGTSVPNMWLVGPDNGVLYVPVIDWLCDPVPVTDWLWWCRGPTAVLSSGQGVDSKPGGDRGAATFEVKESCTVPQFTEAFGNVYVIIS